MQIGLMMQRMMQTGLIVHRGAMVQTVGVAVTPGAAAIWPPISEATFWYAFNSSSVTCIWEILSSSSATRISRLFGFSEPFSSAIEVTPFSWVDWIFSVYTLTHSDVNRFSDRCR